ncbi:MAG TPA: helix-turn-helix domain-containing GNAT family N-acetyltransferase [Burkholderiales bacterium]|nr:helix-turn-helix domain-containing GNAT family N-acetyltransferase [Burkholderiales bacterium]
MLRAMAGTAASRQVEALRAFNRFYTKRIGVLGQGYLQTSHTLTQARVLFELGKRKGASASELAAALGLDPGYLTRIVQQFRSQGLVSRKTSADDRRRVWLSLTARGRDQYRTLDRRSRSEVSTLLARLPTENRSRLVASLEHAQSLLADEKRIRPAKVVIRPYRMGDIGWAIECHARVYAREYRWNAEFEALVAKLFARFANEHDPKFERCWIAEVNGERVGCVFVVRNDEDPSMAQLRCLVVDPRARGLGIGRRLVDQCIAFARSAGYPKIMLWTNDVLVAARRLYEAAGFKLVREEPHHSFGYDLVGQFWVLDLKGSGA